MKVLVCYYSKYGSTKKYAEWIAKKKNGDLIEFGELNEQLLSQYNTIVLGTGIYAGGIRYKKFLNKYEKQLLNTNLILFAVGATPPEEVNKDEIFGFLKKKKLNQNVKTFILRGGFDFNKLSTVDKLLMKMYLKKIEFDKELKKKNNAILNCIKTPSNWIEETSIEQIVKCI